MASSFQLTHRRGHETAAVAPPRVSAFGKVRPTLNRHVDADVLEACKAIGSGGPMCIRAQRRDAVDKGRVKK